MNTLIITKENEELKAGSRCLQNQYNELVKVCELIIERFKTSKCKEVARSTSWDCFQKLESIIKQEKD